MLYASGRSAETFQKQWLQFDLRVIKIITKVKNNRDFDLKLKSNFSVEDCFQ